MAHATTKLGLVWGRERQEAHGRLNERFLSGHDYTRDLAFQATKQTATAIGHSMAAMMATDKHLWLNLVDFKEEEKNVFLDTLVSFSEPFGIPIESM